MTSPLPTWLASQLYSTDPGESQLDYRRGWNAAIRHVLREVERRGKERRS